MPPDIDANDTGLRDQVESATVSAGYDPDRDRAENIARENREMVKRARDPQNVKSIQDFDPKDRLRATIRNAITAHKAKDAGNPAFQPPAKGSDAPIGPPVNWSSEAKAEFANLPQEVRLAALREQKAYQDSLQPIAEYAARAKLIEDAVAPHRSRIPSGMTEPQAVSHLFEWQRALNDPATSRDAYVFLGQQLGLLPADFSQYQQSSSQPQYQQPNHASQEETQLGREIEKSLAEFAKGHEHFQTVRRQMGLLLQADHGKYTGPDGTANLVALYNDACRAQGLYPGGDVRQAQRAAVSPSGNRSPSGTASPERGKGHDVRSSIKSAIAEVRGGGRI